MQISPDGVMTRDEKVFRFARERNIPLLMLTSGDLDTVSCTLFCSMTNMIIYPYINSMLFQVAI